jgi:hypothetical protein
MRSPSHKLIKTAVLACALALGATVTSQAGGPPTGAPGVSPVQSHPYGKTYAEWCALSAKTFMELPLAGHPALDTNPIFDASYGQTGRVWFLGGPFGTQDRWSNIPADTALFFALANAECSSLETPDSGFHGDTPAAQAACATFWSDHIGHVFFVLDGSPVANIGAYRFVSPQYEFDAPTPWLFGDVGGQGTSVVDGYYVMLTPLSVGQHTVHFGATFHFAAGELGPDPVDLPIDMTYHLTVVGPRP